MFRDRIGIIFPASEDEEAEEEEEDEDEDTIERGSKLHIELKV